LIERAGGSLEYVAENRQADADAARADCIRISLPALALIPVLVIDDNPDTIQLFQRYVQGTRYSVVGLQEPAEALRVIGAVNPRILLIDVMMPELDGWDLLTQIRLNHLLPNAAVLICSILPQESLARSLGADGFLQKPVLPQDFLNALDRQMDRLSQEPDHS
jgi:CheY-like chemotaxis protein